MEDLLSGKVNVKSEKFEPEKMKSKKKYKQNKSEEIAAREDGAEYSPISKGEIVIYQTANGALELKSSFSNQTIWANRMEMATIFDVNPQAISKHIQNIYKDKELEKGATSSKMELVQMEAGRAVKRQVDYYNPEIIISVGYRINTVKGTKFRQWASQRLKEYFFILKLAA